MKRRSPWLAFAACALLNGPLFAELPTLPLSKAASAVEAELEKRGLAKDHAVVSVSLVSGKGGPFFAARIEPPVVEKVDDVQTRLTFEVTMDGKVTGSRVTQKSKIRTFSTRIN